MDLKNIVITKILEACTVYSPNGRSEQMQNRKSYALTLCVNGQITYVQNGIKYISQPNTAVILPKGGNYLIRGDKTGFFPVINFECFEFLCDTITVIPIQNAEQFIADFEEIKKLVCFEGNHARIFSIFYGMLHRLSSDKLPTLLENALVGVVHRLTAYGAMLGADEAVVVLTLIDASVECEINNTGLRNLVQHIPGHIGVREVSLQIDMGNRTTGALFIQNSTQSQLLLDGTLGG